MFSITSQAFVVMDEPLVVKLDAYFHPTSKRPENFVEVGLMDVIGFEIHFDVGWACFRTIQMTSFNSLIISANKMVRFQNLY